MIVLMVTEVRYRTLRPNSANYARSTHCVTNRHHAIRFADGWTN